VLRLRIKLFVLVAELIDLGDKLVDLGQAFAEQGFEAADSAVPVF
jgi:hypothetical protein